MTVLLKYDRFTEILTFGDTYTSAAHCSRRGVQTAERAPEALPGLEWVVCTTRTYRDSGLVYPGWCTSEKRVHEAKQCQTVPNSVQTVPEHA